MILGAKGLMELIKRARTTISSIMCCSVLYFGCRCMLFETFNHNTVKFFSLQDVLLEIRAGKMVASGTRVTPDPRKGLIRLVKVGAFHMGDFRIS